MQRSLTILLPVRDDQSQLAERVHRILDVLSDLSNRFELIIIDDGSADATIEVADELAGRYPQITALRHTQSLGKAEAIRSGMRQSSGDIVLVHDGHELRRIDRGTAWPRRPSANPSAETRGHQTKQTGPQRLDYLTRPQTGLPH